MKDIFIAFFLIGLFLGGCASNDRASQTTFEPTTLGGEQRGFRFSAAAHIGYPDNPEGEAVRIDWLNTWLKDNNYCPSGYKIIDRIPIYRGGPGALPANHHNSPKWIHYTGVCN